MPRQLRIERAWVATVRQPDGFTFTTTIYGPTCSEAEQRAEQERPGCRVIVRAEQR